MALPTPDLKAPDKDRDDENYENECGKDSQDILPGQDPEGYGLGVGDATVTAI
jgi:hypothetical protein